MLIDGDPIPEDHISLTDGLIRYLSRKRSTDPSFAAKGQDEQENESISEMLRALSAGPDKGGLRAWHRQPGSTKLESVRPAAWNAEDLGFQVLLFVRDGAPFDGVNYGHLVGRTPFLENNGYEDWLDAQIPGTTHLAKRISSSQPPSSISIIQRNALLKLFYEASQTVTSIDQNRPRSKRQQARPKQVKVTPILESLFPHGIPPKSELSDGELVPRVIAAWEGDQKAKGGKEQAPSRETILRAAGRMV